MAGVVAPQYAPSRGLSWATVGALIGLIHGLLRVLRLTFGEMRGLSGASPHQASSWLLASDSWLLRMTMRSPMRLHKKRTPAIDHIAEQSARFKMLPKFPG